MFEEFDFFEESIDKLIAVQKAFFVSTLTDKTLTLDTRWNFFVKYGKKYGGTEEGGSLLIPELKEICLEYHSRYETISITTILEHSKITDEEIVIVKEYALQENMFFFHIDW